MFSSDSPSSAGNTAVGRIVGPTLEKIVKNATWRKHTHLVSSCKSSLDLLHTSSPLPPPLDPPSVSPLVDVPLFISDSIFSSLLLAVDSSSSKLIEPTLDCLIRLISQRLLSGEISSAGILFKVFESVVNLSAIGDDAMELLILKFFLTAVKSDIILIRGELMVQIVKSCYNVYLGSHAALNQVVAKLVLAQILKVVYARVESDRMEVKVKKISVADMLDLSERSLNDSSLVQTAQGFVDEVMDLGYNDVENGEMKLDLVSGEGEESKIREDGIFLFKHMCKFSMKVAGSEKPDDPLLLKGKVLSLELLKMVVENAGSIWRTNDKFLGAIKQYLCMSLLKNSALSAMSVFQLLCSIFMILLSKLRSGLKGEIGVFFPMLILRVLENVLQPSFQQKMTVLNLLEKVCQDPQTIIDIFVNYDCDVEAPNIFERVVNGLVKTALGVPPGSATTLSPAQESTFRIESVKCLTNIIQSMGTWMDEQLKVDHAIPGTPESEHSKDGFSGIANKEEGSGIENELHSDANSEQNNAATLEQRRVYKLELQKGISMFNRKPSKGIEFLINTKKTGGSPEEVANFLKTTTGLNETMIGDYLGERDDFALKVMHAYVDSMKFEGMDFGDAIRFFLRGFRLPGEAQKIDRIMEKFAERYCKCNPSSFTSLTVKDPDPPSIVGHWLAVPVPLTSM